MCYNTHDLIKSGGGTDPKKPGNLVFTRDERGVM